METYTLSALVTVFSSLLTFYLAYKVWDTRRRTKSFVLDSKQDKEVVLASRVHMNMIEISSVFLPLLWIATVFSNSAVAGLLWVIWFLSRVWYSIVYLKNPDLRTLPFLIGVVCIVCTAILGLYGIAIM